MKNNFKRNYGIRKLSVGVASVSLGVLVALGVNNDAQAAEENLDSQAQNVQNQAEDVQGQAKMSKIK